MAKYGITHSCGHTFEHQIYGPEKDRPRQREWLKSQPCLQCTRQAATKAATQDAESRGLPPLQGSDKQVSWATQLRSEWLRQSERRIPQGHPDEGSVKEAISTAASSQTSAAWWIDHRGNLNTALEPAYLNALQAPKQPKPAAPTSEPAVSRPAAQAAKEPWQMTRAEWFQRDETPIKVEILHSSPIVRREIVSDVKSVYNRKTKRYDAVDDSKVAFYEVKTGRQFDGDYLHKTAIQKALSEGKPVSAEVLAEYPDLARAAKPAAQAPAAAVPEATLEEARTALREFEDAIRGQNAAVDKFGFGSAEADAARVKTRQALERMRQTTSLRDTPPVPEAPAARVAETVSPTEAAAQSSRTRRLSIAAAPSKPRRHKVTRGRKRGPYQPYISTLHGSRPSHVSVRAHQRKWPKRR